MFSYTFQIVSIIHKCAYLTKELYHDKIDLSIKFKEIYFMRATLKDYQDVEKAAMNFVKSVAEGNSKYAKQLFTDEAVLFGILNGELEHGSIEQFYRNVDTVGADANFKARVDVVTVEETLAVVRVLEEGWGGSIDFTDYLLLLKLNGEWKCVAKAYNQNSNTIKK